MKVDTAIHNLENAVEALYQEPLVPDHHTRIEHMFYEKMQVPHSLQTAILARGNHRIGADGVGGRYEATTRLPGYIFNSDLTAETDDQRTVLSSQSPRIPLTEVPIAHDYSLLLDNGDIKDMRLRDCASVKGAMLARTYYPGFGIRGILPISDKLPFYQISRKLLRGFLDSLEQ